MLNTITDDFIPVETLINWRLQTVSPYLVAYLDRLTKNPSDRIFVVSSNSDAMKLLYVILEQISLNFDSKDPWSNSIDPFGYVVGAALAANESDDENLETYANKEKFRQKEKSTSNSIGYFHQGLLRIAFGDPRPIEYLFDNSVKNSFDVISSCKMFGLEVKSKWNTTKGNSRQGLYEKLSVVPGLNSAGAKYFVEVIDKPGRNQCNYTYPVTISNTSIDINLCNGSYIYKKAAERLNLLEPEMAFRKIVESFPAMIWLFSKYYLEILYPNSITKIKDSLIVLNEDLKNEYVDNPLGKLMLAFLNNYLPSLQMEEDKMGHLLKEISAKRPQEPLKALRDLLLSNVEALNKVRKLYSLCYELEHGITKAFHDDQNRSFFVDKLVGHLFKPI
jgi:hypothetical protein